MTVGAGDLNGDGKVDVLARDKAGALWLHAGTGRSLLARPDEARRQLERVRRPHRRRRLHRRRQGRPRTPARPRTAPASIFPGKGNGTFGHPFGPFGRVRGLTSLSGPGTVINTGAPDLVGVQGDRLVVVAALGHAEHARRRSPSARRSRPPAPSSTWGTGTATATAT